MEGGSLRDRSGNKEMNPPDWFVWGKRPKCAISSVSLLGRKSDRPLIKQIPSCFLTLFPPLPRELTNLLFNLFQALRNPPVTLLVCLWPFKSLCHQCESQTRVHRVCGSYHVWNIQRHLPSRAAEHADCHDEQLLPAYCRE